MATRRPNFLIILADDLGYSDIGCFGAEIHTPNIDALAREGARMTDFHATAACSPTRSILMTGTDNHIAGIGCMDEMKAVGGERWNVKGHEGYLNQDVVTLPELLQEAGYHTLLSGKWHLGFHSSSNPHERGFDRSLALLPGAANHYAYEPQFGPDYLDFFERIPPLHSRDGVKVDFEPNVRDAEGGFYSSDTYADNLIDYLKDWKAGAGGAGEAGDAGRQPFFGYLSFTAPHWPLQCAKADRERYKGEYDDGPDALRERRLRALKQSAIHREDVVPYPVVTPGGYSEWQDLTDEEKKLSARAMETYAGMVTAMDRAIGRVIEHLRSIDELDDTVVMFMSDNGACSAAHETMPVFGKTLMTVVHRYYDNSLDNIGQRDSFVWYGPRWAAASTAPHRMYKMYSTEGGLRVCMVLRHPQMHPSFRDNRLLRAFTTIADIAPTILEMADVRHPVPPGQPTGTWRNRTVAGVRGKSWSGYLTRGVDAMDAVHTDDDPAYGWELFGRAALRKGKWKILHVGPAAGGRKDGKWQLYDMHLDPGEVEDVSEAHPGVMRELLEGWEQYVAQTGTVWGEDKAPVESEFFQHKLGQGAPADRTEGGGEGGSLVGGDALDHIRAWMQVGKERGPGKEKK